MKKKKEVIILPLVFPPVSLDLYGLGFGSQLTVGSLTPRRNSSVGLGFGSLSNTYLGSQYIE